MAGQKGIGLSTDFFVLASKATLVTRHEMHLNGEPKLKDRFADGMPLHWQTCPHQEGLSSDERDVTSDHIDIDFSDASPLFNSRTCNHQGRTTFQVAHQILI